MASIHKNSPVRVVVLGPGFGALAAVHRLSSNANNGELELTLIDRGADHIYTPLMYEVATGFLDYSERRCVEALVAGVRFP